jgi:hypothetical protein
MIGFAAERLMELEVGGLICASLNLLFFTSTLECAPFVGQDQAAVLTWGWGVRLRVSNSTRLWWPRAECRRRVL